MHLRMQYFTRIYIEKIYIYIVHPYTAVIKIYTSQIQLHFF